MSEIGRRVRGFSKPASKVNHLYEIAYIVDRSEIIELNNSIEPKIKQNEFERRKSWEIGKDEIVK